MKIDIKIKHNRPDLVVIDKRKREILIVEVGITSANNLQQVETEKLRKYDIIANELTQIYGFTTNIIPYVLSWDGVITKYHGNYRRRLEISNKIEAHIQSLVLKKTFESIFLEFRRSGDIEGSTDDERMTCLESKLEAEVLTAVSGTKS